jgi:hypothetical protein
MSFLGAVLIQRSAIGKHLVHGRLGYSISLVVYLGFGLFFLSFQKMEGVRKCDIHKTYLGLE